MEERSVDTLARYIMMVAVAAVVCLLCWYFRSVLVYIILAAVVSLVSRPIMNFLKKFSIKGKHLPDWICAMLSLILFLAVMIGIVTSLIPVIYGIVQDVSANLQTTSYNTSALRDFLAEANFRLHEWFPSLDQDVTIQSATVKFLTDTFDLSSVTTIVGSVASAIGTLGVGLFSTVFIGFFFIKDPMLFRNIISAIVPEHLEKRAVDAVGDIEHLLTRYFGGLTIEVIGVALLNFISLSIFGKIGTSAAAGIAFMTGMLNVIPYVGPWIGAAIGTVLGVVIRYSGAAAIGASPQLLVVVVTLLACFIVTQMFDNFLFQPLIYSTSIKSSPLEIFIVLLIAGHVGGIIGMLVAIPAYTVIRVIAAEFFYNVKAIRRLIPDKEKSISSPERKKNAIKPAEDIPSDEK